MQAGPFTRSRKIQKQYLSHLKKTKGCDFCKFNARNPDVIKGIGDFWIVKNIFGYDIWDSQDVNEHLMVVPKQHVKSISQLNKKQQAQYLEILNNYEDQGYSIYSRSSKNIALSIAHKHTHFIKMKDKRKKAIFFIRKPHILIHF